MKTDIRRVVTGHDDTGRAIIISDGPAPCVHTDPHEPGFSSIDFWRTFEMPANIDATVPEPTAGPRRQLPTANGSVFRINCFPPEKESVGSAAREDAAAFFASLGNPEGSTFQPGGRHPRMHRTETVDYAIVLSGEITMLLDDSEVHLKTGDVVIQCGTNHAWSNRSAESCVVAFVLLDGRFESALAARFRGVGPKI